MSTRITRLALSLGTAITAIVISSGAAAAHTQLISTTPQAGAQLRESPARVSATFDQKLLPTGDAMVVTDTARRFVNVGSAQLDGATISIGVQPNLPDGTYQVAYRVISADGHPVESSFAFNVGIAVPPANPNPNGAAAGSQGPATTNWSLYVVLLLVFGAVLMVAISLARRRSPRARSARDRPHAS